MSQQRKPWQPPAAQGSKQRTLPGATRPSVGGAAGHAERLLLPEGEREEAAKQAQDQNLPPEEARRQQSRGLLCVCGRYSCGIGPFREV